MTETGQFPILEYCHILRGQITALALTLQRQVRSLCNVQCDPRYRMLLRSAFASL